MKNKLSKTTIPVFYVLLAVIVLLIFTLFNVCKKNSTDSKISSTNKVEIGEKSEGFINNFPEINLPIRYFSEKNIDHGSISENNEWARASFDEMTYQSYPTTTITISEEDYSNDIKNLGHKKSWEEIMKENNECGDNKNEDCGFSDVILENYSEFKDLASYYLPQASVYTDKLDVDGDNIDETLVYSCNAGGNHCPHALDIIKNDKIIFSASLSGININPVETRNGFYLEWNNEYDLTGGYCCPWGYVRTRFVYEDNKFIPILEQKVDYLRVNDKKH